MPRSRDPYSWTSVRLPDRDLAESLLDLAAPLLARLGPEPSIQSARSVIELTVTFWNASVQASQFWGRRRPKALNELRVRMRGKQAGPDDRATFDLLSERWRKSHLFDPRLVDSWTYESDDRGGLRLTCKMGLPDGVRAEVPPPIEKRISISGKHLDEVQIRLGADSYLRFPVERHSGVIAEDGTATVHAMMPSVLQLFAEGRLPPVGGNSVDIVIGGRQLGPMVLHEIRCGGDALSHDTAVLVFKPPPPK
ncbi:MAG: hypothetical protein JW940_17385 [Polyangiaceae bacterium]|nr:hypothetical protein [Polyangiaceae bacterium]